MAGLDLRKYNIEKPVKQKVAPVTKEHAKVKLTDKVKEAVYAELALLLSAGIDIKSSFDLLLDQQAKPKVRLVLSHLQERIVSGYSLSEAMQQENCFSAYEFYSVQIGEETGRLAIVLSDLAGFYKRKIKQRRQLMQALSYPVIVLTTAVGAVAFMLSFIVPMFSDVFRRFGGELPYLTTLIIELSNFLRAYYPVMVVSVGSILFFLWKAKNKLWFRRFSGALLLRLPIVGPIVGGVQLARMCGSMALLTSSRVPLVQAITLVRNMISFYPIQSTLSGVEESLLEGVSLHKALSTYNVYDKRMITLLRVGEETGELGSYFTRLSVQYNEEVEHRSAVMGSALEPIIIIFLGAVVGLVLMAMYLPLFELGTNIN